MLKMFSLRRFLSSIRRRFCGASEVSIEMVLLKPDTHEEDLQKSYQKSRMEALPWCEDTDGIR